MTLNETRHTKEKEKKKTKIGELPNSMQEKKRKTFYMAQ